MMYAEVIFQAIQYDHEYVDLFEMKLVKFIENYSLKND